MVREAASYLCFRTTSLREIMGYFEQYYGIPEDKRKAVLAAARRMKLRMKRAHARLRCSTVEVKSKQEEPLAPPMEIKVE
jgi:hypothetical protein